MKQDLRRHVIDVDRDFDGGIHDDDSVIASTRWFDASPLLRRNRRT